MKLSVIFGVTHMTFGVILGLFNHMLDIFRLVPFKQKMIRNLVIDFQISFHACMYDVIYFRFALQTAPLSVFQKWSFHCE